MMWHRHAGDSRWHTGAPSCGSFLTLCDGRWPLTDADYGDVERHANPAPDERCALCVQRNGALEIERTEVHMIVDHILDDATIARGGMSSLERRLALEVRRLRVEIEQRTHELHVAERELAEAQDPVGTKYGDALVEAIGIAQAAGRRGLLSTREAERLRELAKAVPQ